MKGFLRRLFSPGREAEQPRADEVVEYEGYTITPTPERQSGGGWRLVGTIAKGAGAERRVHHLSRADTSPDRDGIVAMIVTKAKRLIDEQGDRLFS